MMASEVNKNKRIYELESMVTEVARYEKEMIKQDRAMGELNHPTTADVDLERACHIVTEITQEDVKRRADVNIFLFEHSVTTLG